MNNLEITSRMNFLKWLGQAPENLRILSDYCAELEKGAWAQSFIDCVYQYSWHHMPDMYDKYILFDVIQALKRCNGNYLAFQLPVGEGPCADKAIEENNEILGRLPVPFEARFLGGNQDEDGYLQWNRPIHTPIAVGSEFHWALLDALLLPLEVGWRNRPVTPESPQSDRPRWPHRYPDLGFWHKCRKPGSRAGALRQCCMRGV